VQSKSANEVQKLPLVEFTANLWKSQDSWENTLIICVQHIVKSTVSMFSSIIKRGLSPQNLCILGKCYSTRPSALAQLQSMGVNASDLSLAFNSQTDFDTQFKAHVKKFADLELSNRDLSRYERIIVLDDGGELLCYMNTLTLLEEIDVVGIEQTTAGYRKLERSNLKFPVINLARSAAKLDYESPIIADLVWQSIQEALIGQNKQIERILILGKGSLGSYVYSKVCNQYDTDFFDKKIPSNTPEQGILNSLHMFDLIIGCTGTNVFGNDGLPAIKHGAVLASASSGDREFNAIAVRGSLPAYTFCHKHIHSKHGFTLLNSGFPVNFSDRYESIDPPSLQLTRALLCCGLFQGLNLLNSAYSQSKSPGFIDLSVPHATNIIEEYTAKYAREVQVVG
jgi:hypothetical protein